MDDEMTGIEKLRVLRLNKIADQIEREYAEKIRARKEDEKFAIKLECLNVEENYLYAARMAVLNLATIGVDMNEVDELVRGVATFGSIRAYVDHEAERNVE